MRTLLPLFLLAALPTTASAGLHYSGESFRDLPANWRGFLPDHRTLRLVAAPPVGGTASAPPLRDQYADAALKLTAAARTRPLTADEAADLGALHVRLGQPQKAVEILRAAARLHPDHFRLAANLGTAWQLAGDLPQAAASLEAAVQVAPPRWKAAEANHLKLVRLRLTEGRPAKDAAAPDDLFGVRFVGESGRPDPGAIAPAEKAKLPANAVATAQQLALWLPGDGRLLWLLGELANAHGDVRTAANLLDGCVTEFGLGSPDLRARRQLYRAAVDALEAKQEHQRGRGDIVFRSSRALTRGIDPARLPAVRPDGATPLPWAAVAETEFAAKGKPSFLKFVDELDGKRVAITGYMTPAAGAGGELTGFLLTDNPVGCWFCETPGPGQVVAVELAPGSAAELTRAVVKVTGTLRLNRTDPERFPVVIAAASVNPAD